MSIKPILFNTEMVQANLDGRKNNTRRIMKPQPPATAIIEMGARYAVWKRWADDPFGHLIKPPYNPGDVLYVRETWNYNNFGWHYRADWPDDNCPDMSIDDNWHPSIHMPKEAARLFLRVKNVRVERLQDIDSEGIRAEGLNTLAVHAGDMEISQREFAILWDFTIKPADLPLYGWDANPWVWVIEFERCEKPAEVNCNG